MQSLLLYCPNSEKLTRSLLACEGEGCWVQQGGELVSNDVSEFL